MMMVERIAIWYRDNQEKKTPGLWTNEFAPQPGDRLGVSFKPLDVGLAATGNRTARV
jgi:hypothetical protein